MLMLMLMEDEEEEEEDEEEEEEGEEEDDDEDDENKNNNNNNPGDLNYHHYHHHIYWQFRWGRRENFVEVEEKRKYTPIIIIIFPYICGIVKPRLLYTTSLKRKLTNSILIKLGEVGR